MTERVLLTDFRKDIPEIMNALDAFVMPSYEENFANVLLEALASGLPTIGTRSGGTPEILDNGHTGLLCEPRSTTSLAAAMRSLLTDPDLRERLRERARAKALKEYAMERVFARIETLVSTPAGTNFRLDRMRNFPHSSKSYVTKDSGHRKRGICRSGPSEAAGGAGTHRLRSRQP
ncbi:MAG: glycosyltransferase family 4 protein [Calothrix sp. SM1_5_4]|nr:glycosyltransferase family 4 protein [Calothrix sp. SM1_5_4]